MIPLCCGNTHTHTHTHTDEPYTHTHTQRLTSHTNTAGLPSVDCYYLNQWVLPNLWQVQRSATQLTTFDPSLAEETNGTSLQCLLYHLNNSVNLLNLCALSYIRDTVSTKNSLSLGTLWVIHWNARAQNLHKCFQTFNNQLTPTTESPSTSLWFLCPWGTQPVITRDFPNSRPLRIEFLRPSSEGPFTVQLFNTHKSALSGDSKV